MNWHTGDQELLDFVISLQNWDVYLKGVEFTLNSDHKPILFLQTKPRLSPRQQRWLDLFQLHDWATNHIKGEANTAADVLSRKSDLRFKPLARMGLDLRDLIMRAQSADEFSCKMKEKLVDSAVEWPDALEKAVKIFWMEEEILAWKRSGHGWAYISDHGELQRDVVKQFCETVHLGVAKVYSSMARYIYWRVMFENICRWISICKTFLANKVEKQKASRLLVSHDVQKRCWKHIITDFVIGFPTSKNRKGFVLVVVDKLSKRVIFVPTTKKVTSEEVAELFDVHAFSKHGVP